MPENITRYRVFIASPGGLKEEREAFREALQDYNDEINELERDVTFMSVGWEATLGGVGRPQSMINQDIAKCDGCGSHSEHIFRRQPGRPCATGVTSAA